MRKSILRMLPVLIIAVMALSTIGCGTQVPSGHRAVFFYKFGEGTEMGKIYPEGFNWHLPWNSMFVYRIQTQERKENLTVLSSDGATIKMEVSVLFRPIPTKLDSLQITIGRNYYDDVVAPTMRSVAREIAGRFTPEEIYSSKRDEVTAEIADRMATQMIERFVNVQNVLIRDVTIPDKISEAINFKLTAAQEAEKMKFTIEREKLEAERKRVEARGIADFQQIISAGITPSYLKWKGIEATQTLAESPNAKVIMIGNDASSMPVILSAEGQ